MENILTPNQCYLGFYKVEHFDMIKINNNFDIDLLNNSENKKDNIIILWYNNWKKFIKNNNIYNNKANNDKNKSINKELNIDDILNYC